MPSTYCNWACAVVVLSNSVGCGRSAQRALGSWCHSSNLAVAPRVGALRNASLGRAGKPGRVTQGRGQPVASSGPGLGSPGSPMETQEGLASTACPLPPSPISPSKRKITGKQTLGGERRMFLIKSLREFTTRGRQSKRRQGDSGGRAQGKVGHTN